MVVPRSFDSLHCIPVAQDDMQRDALRPANVIARAQARGNPFSCGGSKMNRGMPATGSAQARGPGRGLKVRIPTSSYTLLGMIVVVVVAAMTDRQRKSGEVKVTLPLFIIYHNNATRKIGRLVL